MLLAMAIPSSRIMIRNSLLIVVYLSLWVSFYVVTHEHGTELDAPVLVLAVESCKLLVTCCILFFQNIVLPLSQKHQSKIFNGISKNDDNRHDMVAASKSIRRKEFVSLLLAYLPIAAMYAAVNNLMLINLKGLDPVTYLILMSSRVLLTAVAWKIGMPHRGSNVSIASSQWRALIFITVGVLLRNLEKGYHSIKAGAMEENAKERHYWFYVGLLLLQLLCSVVASVANERMLKANHGNLLTTDPHMNNLCLYLNSIAINALIAISIGTTSNDNDTSTTLMPLFERIVQALQKSPSPILLLAFAGISTSLFLKFMSSVSKAIASAAEPALCSIVGWFYFGYTLTTGQVLSTLFVGTGSLLYSSVTFVSVTSNISSLLQFLVQGINHTPRSVLSFSLRRVRKEYFLLILCCGAATRAFEWHTRLLDDELFLQMTASRRLGNRPRWLSTVASCQNRTSSMLDRDAKMKHIVMASATRALDSIGADHMLAAGTLLGFYRECRHMAHDIDFFVSSTEAVSAERIKRAFYDQGFGLHRTMFGLDGTVESLGGELAFVKRGIKVDVFFTQATPNYIFNGLTFNKQHLLLCRKPTSARETFDWDGTRVRIPTPTHDMLLNAYGENYMIPQHTSWPDRVSEAVHTGRCLYMSNINQDASFSRYLDDSGLVAVIKSGDQVLQALSLVETLSRQWPNPPSIEFFHNGTLSLFLQEELQAYSFVSVIEVLGQSLEAAALQKTSLKHILWIEPSIVFLQDPRHILQNAKFVDTVFDNEACDPYCLTTTKDITVDPQSSSGRLRVWPHVTMARIVTLKSTRTVALVHEGAPRVGLWMYPSTTSQVWTKHLLSLSSHAFYVSHPGEELTGLAEEDLVQLQTSWHSYIRAVRLFMMDRSIDWVAFDGGLNFATLNSLTNAKESQRMGAPVISLDLAKSIDGQLITIHDDHAILPDSFGTALLGKPVSEMNGSNARTIDIPCVPQRILRSLRHNAYHSIPCVEDTIASAESFLSNLPEVDLIWDLKGRTDLDQVEMARNLAKSQQGHRRNTAVRFFSSNEAKKELEASIIAETSLQSLSEDPELRTLPFYINVPTSLACSQFAAWIHRKASHKKPNFAGCFVIMNHTRIENDWQHFVGRHGINIGSYTPTPKGVRQICDVPRSEMNSATLRSGYIACVHAGFDLIHHPFPVSSTHFSLIPELTKLPTIDNIFIDSLSRNLQEVVTDDVWREYRTQWSYTSPSDWQHRKHRLYRGNDLVSDTQPPLHSQNVIFRCVTKAISTMLFLRLKEIGLLRLDQTWPGLIPHDATLRMIVSNLHQNGTEGLSFRYDNDRWQYIPEVVRRVTGLSFEDAIQYHILDPMGIGGHFDKNTSIPPYAARGFVGSMDDVMLVGSTLAAGGVSPLTRRQVISSSSVEEMLASSTTQFSGETTDELTGRFHFSNGTLPRHGGIVDGYGLGIWRVEGWRLGGKKHESDETAPPIRGWLARGSSEVLMYFDTTGLVVSMCAEQRIMGYEMTPVFANVVGEVGHVIDDSLANDNLDL